MLSAGSRYYVLGLQSDNVLSLEALIAVDHGELHLLALFQITEAIATDRAEVYEDIISTVARDKAKALGAIEPLNGSLFSISHLDLELLSCKFRTTGPNRLGLPPLV